MATKTSTKSNTQGSLQERSDNSHLPSSCHQVPSELCRKPEFGKSSENILKGVDALIHSMIYAANEDDYNTLASNHCVGCAAAEATLSSLKRLSKSGTATRKCGCCIGEPKGQLEADFNDEGVCVKGIIACSRCAENDYGHRRAKNGYPVNVNYDEEMSLILRLTMGFVAKEIKPEYAAALAKFDSYVYEVDETKNVVFVVTRCIRYCLSLLDWSRDCPFVMSVKLP